MTDDNDIYDKAAKRESKLKCLCARFARGLMKWKSLCLEGIVCNFILPTCGQITEKQAYKDEK